MDGRKKTEGWKRGGWAVLAAAVVAGALSQVRAGAEAPLPDRLAVWRAIFARPAVPVQASEAAKIALGYDLFRDPRLSGAGATACATCHNPDRAFTDGRKTGRGPAGTLLTRNVPSLYDLAAATSFFWDGRAPSLEAQARVPITAPDEMAGQFPEITARLNADNRMRARFAAVYPTATGIGETEIVDALAAYERSLASPETRFDRWVAGDEQALSAEELRGFDIFVGKGGCVTCHGGWRFTDDNFHDVGLRSADLGRGALEGAGGAIPAFKTPSLREAAHTAPYMHDGSLATLADVVKHYAGGLDQRPSLAPTIVRDLALTDEEQAALVAFIKTVSSAPQAAGEGDETSRPVPNK